ncbi:STAS domain-containing protein [Pseudonocardia humida]|uniref:STAS domain-containing protein n=1 Tax=Pseudonocardia humida TaxID=2800819 RepID=A0ABT0ZV09_9PSEU|nr:STAS domain-containing protein [Pseudonocardia humida]MCO1654570.1 STAS domain-containing protein [Pseudonocardia humida]
MAQLPGDSFHCTLCPVGDVDVLRIVGDIDTLTTSAFTGALAEALARGPRDGPGQLVLDLGGVGFVSVAGMRSIVEAAQAAAEAGIVFRVAGLAALQRSLAELIWPGTLRHGFPTAQDAGAAP